MRAGYAAALDAGGTPAWQRPPGEVERIDAGGACRVPPRPYDW